MFHRIRDAAKHKAWTIVLRELLVERKTAGSSNLKGTLGERQFYAEAEYADTIFREARGDREGSRRLETRLEAMPTTRWPFSVWVRSCIKRTPSLPFQRPQ
jgi:hypothetical protein